MFKEILGFMWCLFFLLKCDYISDYSFKTKFGQVYPIFFLNERKSKTEGEKFTQTLDFSPLNLLL